MEKKQLDFNAPLLSVRRFPSKLGHSNGDNRETMEKSLPNRRHNLFSVKSDMNLDQVTEPVAVPFLWEHIPGRAKSRSGPLPQSKPLDVSSASPRLPPGKVWDNISLPSNKKLGDQNAIQPQPQASFVDYSNLTKLESSRESVNEKCSSDWENGDGDDDDDDDAYSDALDTLSSTSCSLNCSVSGLSGSDGPDVKPSGTFSTDPQTLDFMMSRFLPAAKAMTLETPHYVLRKQQMAHEQPREVRMMSEGRRPLLKQYESRIIPYIEQGEKDEESESEDDNYDDSTILSAKSCGFLPRFCVKNSLCLLNPVPGLKTRTRNPKASTIEVRKQRKTSYSGPQCQNVYKHDWDAVNKYKSDYGVQLHEMYEVKNKQTAESNDVSYCSDSQRADRSSPYRHSRGGRISPYRSEAPVSPLHQGMGFLGFPKEAEIFEANRSNKFNKHGNNFHKVLSSQRNEQGSGSMIPTVEKTVYIDFVNIVENSDTKGKMDYASNKNSKILAESREMETTAESSLQDIKSLNVLEGGGISKAKFPGFLNGDIPSYSDISHLKDQAHLRLDHESRSLECLKVSADDESLDVNSDHTIKEDNQANSLVVSSLKTTISPPLPKSPSESWLWRTLPSVPSRNSFSRSKKLAPTISSTGSKWESIVKTSNLYHDHVRYSEELVVHAPKQSRT